MTKSQGLGIDHTGIGVESLATMANFYDGVLGALGMSRLMQVGPDGSFVTPDGDLAGIGYGYAFPVFWIDRFHPARARNHTAFIARSREEVSAFFDAGLANGGQDNGRPGLRPVNAGYPSGYYAAFVIDPEGNNVEAILREA